MRWDFEHVQHSATAEGSQYSMATTPQLHELQHHLLRSLVCHTFVARKLFPCTVKEEIFVGEKFRTFPSKTFRMELNFVLSNWPKNWKTRKDDRKTCKPCGRNFGWKSILYIFELYESNEIKFPSKNSSFTVVHLLPFHKKFVILFLSYFCVASLLMHWLFTSASDCTT